MKDNFNTVADFMENISYKLSENFEIIFVYLPDLICYVVNCALDILEWEYILGKFRALKGIVNI